MPLHEAIVLAESSERSKVLSSLMFSRHAIDAALAEQVEVSIAAEPSVRQEYVVRFEPTPEPSQQFLFGDLQCIFRQVQQDPGSQREDRDDAHDGKTASGFLLFVLGVDLLILRGIEHGQAGTIGNPHPSPPPQAPFLPGRLSLDSPGRLSSDSFDLILGQLSSCLAVGGGVRGSGLVFFRGQPGQELTDGLSTGTLRGEHLIQEEPEHS